MNNSYSLYDLHKYIKQVFALNFSDAIWIHAEISQAKEVRGQIYIDLIEKSENTDQVIAQGNAIIQFKTLLFLRKKLGKILDTIIREGTAIKIKVSLDFHERYGYKIMIDDIDLNYTIGQVAIRRQEIIDRLDTEGLVHTNDGIPMPTIVQRLAVISSSTAAGYKDFEQQLLHNDYGYQFRIDLYQTSMQGQKTASELVNSIHKIDTSNSAYDCIIIIRGGGSKLDLASFDHYNIGHAIATANHPVICGIGHEIDNTVADLVAQLSLKTPTAVAEYLISRCLQYESELESIHRQMQYTIKDILHVLNINLNNLGQSIKYLPKELIQKQFHNLKNTYSSLDNIVQTKLNHHKQSLSTMEKIVVLSDPIKILKKGFVITSQDENIIDSLSKFDSTKALKLRYHDGEKEIQIDNSKK